jgi:carbon storage regulator
MLLLSRKVSETIMIEIPGATVEVTVMGVAGNQVRLGITAPKHVPVNRLEIYNRIQLEKIA